MFSYITPKARAGFGQLTEKQKSQLEAVGFMFELPDDIKPPEPVDWEEVTLLLKYGYGQTNLTCFAEYI
jgi:hypothetical protein